MGIDWSADLDAFRQKLRRSFRSRGEPVKEAKGAFYRGEVVNFNPRQTDYFKESFLETYLLKGWLPSAPVLAKGTKITAFGSCFAGNISRYLSAIGFNLSKDRAPDIHVSSIGEGLVNVHALASQFEWALENKQFGDLWHGYDAGRVGMDETVRIKTRDVFLETEFFIITLGLSEIWYDELTGGVFWRAVPLGRFDPSRHKFRVASLAETKAQIALMYDLIRKHVPAAKVLFTLSPIPLVATFRPISCLTASTVSKAILRAALDEFLREHEEDLNTRLFYFPSYEFVNELFPSRFLPDNRHPHDIILYTIMKTFEAAYCETSCTLAEAEALYQNVRNTMLKELPRLRPRLSKADRRAGVQLKGGSGADPLAISSASHFPAHLSALGSLEWREWAERASAAASRRLKPILKWAR